MRRYCVAGRTRKWVHQPSLSWNSIVARSTEYIFHVCNACILVGSSTGPQQWGNGAASYFVGGGGGVDYRYLYYHDKYQPTIARPVAPVILRPLHPKKKSWPARKGTELQCVVGRKRSEMVLGQARLPNIVTAKSTFSSPALWKLVDTHPLPRPELPVWLPFLLFIPHPPLSESFTTSIKSQRHQQSSLLLARAGVFKLINSAPVHPFIRSHWEGDHLF